MNTLLKHGAISFGMGIIIMMAPNQASAQMILNVEKSTSSIVVDGIASEWDGISGITVPLEGKGGVDSVEIKAAIRDDKIYVLAVWNDSTQNIQHKPYKWDEASQSYKRTKQMEDRFAVSFAISGQFSNSKIGGSEFKADVWHWKAARSNPAGIAQDKMWVISLKKLKKANKFKTPDGKEVYVGRYSDKGDKLYKSTTYDIKEQDMMPRYVVNTNPTGSIADVKAKGVWKDGKWTLEMSRKLNTGNDDDAVIPAAGAIDIAIAAFNQVSGEKHSFSKKITLNTSK